jgi:hypothetical protein
MSKKTVNISVNQSADGKHFDFTYAPTTLHLRAGAGDFVSFVIVQGTAPVDRLILIFEHSPFRNGETEISLAANGPAVEYEIGTQRGAYHYKSIGDAVVKGERRTVYDLWCPSIIVD